MPNEQTFLEEIDRLDRWCQRHPDIPSLLTHGFSPSLLGDDMPGPVARLLSRKSMMIELLYPIHWGRLHAYPYPELRPTIQKLIDCAGPDRLTWGSDMPNVLRNCTYKQSLDYLYPLLDGMVTSEEKDAILGGNVLRLAGHS
jgi:predicted TIM-barrel fold metal-dependent hydrolase